MSNKLKKYSNLNRLILAVRRNSFEHTASITVLIVDWLKHNKGLSKDCDTRIALSLLPDLSVHEIDKITCDITDLIPGDSITKSDCVDVYLHICELLKYPPPTTKIYNDKGTISLRLENELITKLDRMAFENNLNRSDFLRKIILNKLGVDELL